MSVPSRMSQRRPPTGDLPAPPVPPQAGGPPPNSRMSTMSTRSGRSMSSDKQISQIEKSVTHLLVATKQLLETLTQWSRKQATEGEVSDVYVRLGYEFNLACRAFSSIGVDTTDLGPVPDLLRAILEDTLSQEASPQSLDQYLPKIRDIIINLLQGLKRKQSKLRNKTNRQTSGGSTSTNPNRQTTAGVYSGNDFPIPQAMEPEQMPMQDPRRQVGDGRFDTGVEEQASMVRGPSTSPDSGMRRDARKTAPSVPASTSNNMQNPVPYPEGENGIPANFPPPPPPPKQQDALAALQRGGDLERRASRRFSAYQISKHLGAPNGMTLAPTQTSPAPNRGRDMRESMNAVRSRASFRNSRQKSSSRLGSNSPNRRLPGTDVIAEERAESRQPPRITPPNTMTTDDSPVAKTPEDKYRQPAENGGSDTPTLGATITGPLPSLPEPMPDVLPEPSKKEPTQDSEDSQNGPGPSIQDAEPRATETPPPQSRQYTPEDSPPPGKELTLFLQYKSKIKKFVLPEGYNELTVARLQLAFIEKFAWNTHNNGVDLPEIYIQDPVSGVRHELEDLSDVKDRSVLVLNVEVLDEVKKHFDDGLGGIRQLLENVRGAVENQESMMQRFSDRQLETVKDMARIAAAPPTPSVPVKSPMQPGFRQSVASAATISEVQSLRREIAVLRQSYSAMASDFDASMQNIRAKGANVKSIAASAAIPTFSSNAGRGHVENGRKTLQDDSETLVNRVDDLSDLVEDLRKDVVTRGVRPLPRQLETISKDISSTVKDLTKVREFLKREKPVWTKIWEKELDQVCQERDELTQQEDLMADLTGDLEDLSNVFKLVEEATKQQNLQAAVGSPTSGRAPSRTIPFDTFVDPRRAKDGVLDEVRALQPNHEDRLEAIERAERARQRELESRKGGEFQREVESFVEEGKLKRTGGAEEVERVRKLKDEQARRANWDRAAARRADMEEQERLEALAAAQEEELPNSASTAEPDSAPTQDETKDVVAGGEEATVTPATTPGEPPENVDKEEKSKVEPEPNVEETASSKAPSSPIPSSPTKRSSSWLPAIFSG